ncbi:MAG: hypothetical protein EA426_17515 [Spirochaetaceae bacterium]|nr:MAG: hypothetical protein EA426_17515 [Spirochaetaceae bacterium]
MLGMSIASALTVFLSLLLGYVVFRRNINSRIRQAFLLLAFTLAAWAFIAVLAYPARDVSTFMILFRISFVFQMLHFGAVLHFIVEVTRLTLKRHRRVYLVYLPCIVTIIFFFVGKDYVEGFTIVEGVLQFNHRYDTVAFFGLLVIWFSYYGTAVHLCLRRAHFSVTARERRLFRILAASLVIIVAITFIEVMIFPLLFAVASQGMVIFFKFLWLLCIGYLVDRYRFLTAPAGLEDIALAAFPGYVVLILDNDHTIRRANQEAARILSQRDEELEGTHITSILPAAKEILEELENDRSVGTMSRMIAIGTDGGAAGFLDTRGSVLHDKSEQSIGFMLVGTEVNRHRLGNRADSLSRREREIVEQIVIGLSNAEIAERLFISERTVATHITRIFSKLGVENRIQLYELMKNNRLASGRFTDATPR